MKKTSILLILIMVTLLAVTTPVAAVSLHIDLGKTYKSHLMNISAIDAIDIWSLNQTQSQVLTTAGDSSDIQTLHNPTFNTLRRNFNPATGTATHATVTVSGTNPSTVDWTTLPAYKFYTQPKVPTIRQVIPGKSGNPLISQYNASWVNGAGSDSGLFLASDGIDLYKTGGILNINTKNDSYTNIGTFSAGDYNTSDFVYTLAQNQLAVDDFSSSATQANLLGNAHPELRANTGNYFLSTVEHNEPGNTTNVYSVYRVVALKAPTPLTWKNSSTTYSANEYTYFKGSNKDVVLGFNVSGANPDISSINNITYLIIDRTAAYDINMDVDTNKVAENSESQWQNSLSSGQVIDLLYATLANDVNLPFTYTLTATGVATAPSTTHSNIAITPGYGISGNTTARLVTVPGAALESLHTGYYDIYLMGTNSKNEVAGLDQKTVRVVTGAAPTVTGITPASGKRGQLVSITNLAGTGFVTGATVKLTKAGSADIAATNVTVVNANKITFTVKLPAGATIGKWNVRVTNPDTQFGYKFAIFRLMTVLPPTVTGITPAQGKQGQLVTVTNLAGTGFVQGARARLTRLGFVPIDATNVTVVSANKITCTFQIPAGETIGKWNVKVTNADNQFGFKYAIFRLMTPLPPTVTGITPAFGQQGHLVTVTNLSGTRFVQGAKVRLTRTGTAAIDATNVTVLSANKIRCTFQIPAHATPLLWNVKVTNADNQAGTKIGIFKVNV